MTKEELIHDIKERFRFSINDFKRGIPDYELELVYQVYPNLSPKEINDILKEYCQGKFKAKAPKRDVSYSPPERRFRGISNESVII